MVPEVISELKLKKMPCELYKGRSACISAEAGQGPVAQSIVSLTSLLMTNSLTVVAKVFLNTLIRGTFCSLVQNA